MTVAALIAQIQRYRSYLRHGGVTVSGGEPLMQPDFVAELLRECQAMGLHTALDTSGYAPAHAVDRVLAHTDLVLLDLKAYNPETYQRVTGVSLQPTLNFAAHLSAIAKPTWIRFVLVPGLTDNPAEIEQLAEFVSTLRNVERVEVLPFHQMGEHKWTAMGLPYALKDTPPPSLGAIAHTVEQFERWGLPVVAG